MPQSPHPLNAPLYHSAKISNTFSFNAFLTDSKLLHRSAVNRSDRLHCRPAFLEEKDGQTDADTDSQDATAYTDDTYAITTSAPVYDLDSQIIQSGLKLAHFLYAL